MSQIIGAICLCKCHIPNDGIAHLWCRLVCLNCSFHFLVQERGTREGWVKVKRHSFSFTHLIAMGHYLSYGITQCCLSPNTGECARPNPARKAGTRLTYPGGMEGWVDLGGWLHRRWFTSPQTVTHPSINRARRTVTTLIKTNVLLLSQATTRAGDGG